MKLNIMFVSLILAISKWLNISFDYDFLPLFNNFNYYYYSSYFNRKEFFNFAVTFKIQGKD